MHQRREEYRLSSARGSFDGERDGGGGKRTGSEEGSELDDLQESSSSASLPAPGLVSRFWSQRYFSSLKRAESPFRRR